MKIKELFEMNFLGTCVNSFDEDGDCVIPGLYRDASDFASHEENAKKITQQEFESKVGKLSIDLSKKISKDREYYHDEDGNIYYIYDVKKDIHYFFR